MSTIETPNPIAGSDPRTKRLRVVVASAALLALNATPAELVPAPGADLALIFDGAVIRKPAGAAYAGIAAGEDLSVKYTNAAGLEVGQAETTGFLDQTTDQVRWVARHAAASGNSAIVPVANAALVLHLLAGEIITGDSDLELEVHYRVVRTVP